MMSGLSLLITGSSLTREAKSPKGEISLTIGKRITSAPAALAVQARVPLSEQITVCRNSFLFA